MNVQNNVLEKWRERTENLEKEQNLFESTRRSSTKRSTIIQNMQSSNRSSLN
jgi:hypothetical protein